jgi:hypothetical protein
MGTLEGFVEVVCRDLSIPLERHQSGCNLVKGKVEVSWTADIEEVRGGGLTLRRSSLKIRWLSPRAVVA